ncbi:MAG: hypothetical protein ACYDBJ_24560 [Aggregatilineales bacterium]
MADQPNESEQLSKTELSALVEQFRQAVNQMPPDLEENGKRIGRLVDELIEEASASEPSKDALITQANHIKQATDTIAETAPNVVEIATKIVAGVLLPLNGDS